MTENERHIRALTAAMYSLRLALWEEVAAIANRPRLALSAIFSATGHMLLDAADWIAPIVPAWVIYAGRCDDDERGQ